MHLFLVENLLQDHSLWWSFYRMNLFLIYPYLKFRLLWFIFMWKFLSNPEFWSACRFYLFFLPIPCALQNKNSSSLKFTRYFNVKSSLEISLLSAFTVIFVFGFWEYVLGGAGFFFFIFISILYLTITFSLYLVTIFVIKLCVQFCLWKKKVFCSVIILCGNQSRFWQ